MEGSFWGNVTGIAYFLAFQCFGILLSHAVLKKEASSLKLLVGSVFGSVLMQWIPLLFSFFLTFSLSAHLLALVLVGSASIVFFLRSRQSFYMLVPKRLPKVHVWLLIPALTYLIFCGLALHSFRLKDGAIHSSQCTFGDMSMHLGFITSIATQTTFPPQYSILSGVPLAYPFLSDSISSSIYLLGASLRLAYLFPMFFAGAQVFAGVLLLLRQWFQERKRIVVAFLLFFFNGGFGFAYFFSSLQKKPENFTRILTAFYETPTNLVDNNVRWSNIIVDMLIPQRATLFGWAVLFTALLLLHKGIVEKSTRCFALTGILAGTLPMIHTHSFLALALVSAAWLAVSLFKQAYPATKCYGLKYSLSSFPFIMVLLQLLLQKERETDWLLFTALIVGVCFIALIVVLLVRTRSSLRQTARTWGIYLFLTMIFAVPQLLKWTFQQAQGEHFLRGYFNWANINDQYLWFYIVNIGIVALLFLPAVLWAKKSHQMLLAPILLIWGLVELVVFQPNTYDNNKLLYIAYFFLCTLVADYLVTLYESVQHISGVRVLAATTAILATSSALLTISRESVADYELFSNEQIKVAQYIASAADPKAVILTSTNHNNAIAALSGRNIICGSASYVYFHGLDHTSRSADIKTMYETPSTAEQLYQFYGISYILISDYERQNYLVDEAYLQSMFPLVFETERSKIYQVMHST